MPFPTARALPAPRGFDSNCELGCIPAGGYVSLPQMAPMETIEGRSDKPREPLPTVSAWDKIIVAFAGPLFSFGLAVVFAMVVWGVGRPERESEKTTVVGEVDKTSPAYNFLRPGDRLLEVDGKPVTKWGGMGTSVKWRVVRSEGDTIPIKFERDGKIISFDSGFVKEKTRPWQRKSLREIQIEPAFTPNDGFHQHRIKLVFQRDGPDEAIVLLKPSRTHPFVNRVNRIPR